MIIVKYVFAGNVKHIDTYVCKKRDDFLLSKKIYDFNTVAVRKQESYLQMWYYQTEAENTAVIVTFNVNSCVKYLYDMIV